MKKIKIAIVILIIIILVILTSLIFIDKEKTNIINNVNENFIEQDFEDDITNNINDNEDTVSYYKGNQAPTASDKIKKVSNSTRFYTVSNCIQMYLDNITKKNNTATYDVLNSEYIANNKITPDNALNYVNKIEKSYFFNPLEMRVLEGITTEVYSVYGKILEKDKSGIGEDIFFIVNLCRENSTYSITPLLNNEYKQIDQIKIDNEDIAINKNDNNKYSYYKITEEELIRKYISNYKTNMKYNTKKAYELLDSNYKKERFNNEYNQYVEYIEENKTNINNSLLSEYKKIENYNNDFNIYVCIDNNQNYYIFKETATMDYTVMLDNYTVMLEETKKEYNELDKYDKSKYNLVKFIKMVNTKDYNAIYNVLDNTFKTNNFKNLEELKKYIKSNFYNLNDLKIESYEESQGYYIFNCEIENIKNDDEVKDVTVVINQSEGTDFTMSFSFE